MTDVGLVKLRIVAGVCAVLLVKDEADIIGQTVRHLLGQLDHVVVVDNLSTDATAEIAAELGAEVARDPEPAFFQDTKMTAWAQEMRNRGFEWMIPCDADEFWYSYDGATLATRLGSLDPEVDVAVAAIFDHVPTRIDPDDVDPFRRIAWHRRTVSPIWGVKVACRLHDGLSIGYGNHSAFLNGGPAKERVALAIRHYPYRTADQYVCKLKNLYRATELTDYPWLSSIGHWRRAAGLSDSQLIEQFETAHKVSDPHLDTSLVYDPAPLERNPERRKRELEQSPATSVMRVLERASTIDGWMSPKELSFLFELARAMPKDARVAEVGSWKGRSTTAICEGLRLRVNPILYAVDWFVGDPQVQAQVGDFNPTEVRSSFERNTSDYPFVRLMVDLSEAAAAKFDDHTLDWIFLDANHSYESVVADIFAWAPKLKPGGLMSGHDFGFYGVSEAVLRSFGPVDHVGTCWYTRAKPRPRLAVELRRLYSRVRTNLGRLHIP